MVTGGDAAETTVRPAVAADLAAIVRIVEAAYGHYVARIGRPPAPMREDYAAHLGAGTLHVAAGPGGVAGLIVLLEQPDHLLVDNVAVAPALQGRGIGRLLLAFAEQQARRRGFIEMRLYTHVLMTENLALYTALGWRETGRGEQSGYQRVFMAKPL